MDVGSSPILRLPPELLLLVLEILDIPDILYVRQVSTKYALTRSLKPYDD